MTTMAAVQEVARAVILFWRSLLFFLYNGSYREAPEWFQKLPSHTKVHLYSLALIFEIWGQPHYRNGTFQEDMVKNLRNVAIPGTGIPLSWVAKSRIVSYWFLLFVYPVIALVSGWYHGKDDSV